MTSSIYSDFSDFSNLKQQACSVSWVRVKPTQDKTLDTTTLANINNVGAAKSYISSIKCPEIKKMSENTPRSNLALTSPHRKKPSPRSTSQRPRIDHSAPAHVEEDLASTETNSSEMSSMQSSPKTEPVNGMRDPSNKKISFKSIMSSAKKDISEIIKKDITSVSTNGRWMKDMKAIAWTHYLINQRKVLVPTTMLGLAAVIVAAGIKAGLIIGTAGIAIPAVIGCLVVGVGVYAYANKAKIWNQRENLKKFFDDNFTSTVIGRKMGGSSTDQKSLFSHTFSSKVDRMDDIILSYLSKQTNKEYFHEDIREDNELKKKTIKKIISIVYGDREEILSNAEVQKFKHYLPDILKKYNSLSNGPAYEGKKEDVKINLQNEFGPSLLNTKKYSELLSKSQSTLILKPITVSKEKYDEFLENPNRCSDNNELFNEDISHIISVKPVTTSNDQTETLYRIYGAKRIPNNNSKTSIEEIKKQIKRTLISKDEVYFAQHGSDNTSKIIYEMIFNRTSPLFNNDIRTNLETIFGNQETVKIDNNIVYNPFKKDSHGNIIHNSYAIHFFFKNINLFQKHILNESSKDKNKFAKTLNIFENSYLFNSSLSNSGHSLQTIDINANMSMDEADYLYYDVTGSRNPISSLGAERKFLNKTRHEFYVRKIKERHVNALITQNPSTFGNTQQSTNPNIFSDIFNPAKATLSTLPLKDKLNFNSTHISKLHSHWYLSKLQELDLIAYVNNNDTDSDHYDKNFDELSQGVLAKNYKENSRENILSTNTNGTIHKAKKSDKNASFGPAESSNSRSMVGGLKRFNAAREFIISSAALFKIQDTETENELSNPEISNNINASEDDNEKVFRTSNQTFKDMNHAMNIQVLKNEIEKVQSSIMDLNLILKSYTKYKGTLTAQQIISLNQDINKINSNTQPDKYKNLDKTEIVSSDILVIQKKIKLYTADLSDQLHSLFKTKLDYSIAYDNDTSASVIKKQFNINQQNEMNEIFNLIEKISSDRNIKDLMKNTQDSIEHNRSRFLGSFNFFNAFRGRKRLPALKTLTFKGTMKNILGKDIANGFKTIEKSLDVVTENLFNINDILYENKLKNKTNSFENLEYIENLTY